MNVDAVELDNSKHWKSHGETSAGTGTQESCIYSTAAYGKAEAAFEAGRRLPERI